jgi:tetratricopeptide (TPR) repeat protein
VLLGLIGYTAGYDRSARGDRGGASLAALSIVLCTMLGILSKANGALLPLFAWILDAIVLRANGAPGRGFASMRRVVVVAPSLAMGAYLVYQAYAGIAKGVLPERPWTLVERLLTEPRVVVDYLALLWIPRPYSTGLFNDGIVASSGLLTPPTTLPSMLVIAALLVFAFAFRGRYAAWSAAILFYFAGQLLESTSIPLELYFEHRNYVPALLMFWPLALWLCSNDAVTMPDASRTLAVLRRVLSLVLPLGLAALTFLRADLWGNSADQALLWGEQNTHSPRAQAYAAQVEAAHGHVAAGIARLERALAEHPDEIQLALNLIGLKCTVDTLTADDIARASTALRETRNVGRLGFEWFEEALPAVREHRCRALDLPTVEALLAAAASNPTVVATFGRRQDILNLQARIALAKHEPERALALFDAALEADPRPGAALQQATTLATAGFPALALAHIDHLEKIWKPVTHPAPRMPAIHQWLLWREGYWQHEIAHLRAVLEDDVKSRAAPAEPPAGAQ